MSETDQKPKKKGNGIHNVPPENRTGKQNGGAQPGAGRPPGAIGETMKIRKKIREQFLTDGKATPLDVIVSNMRHWHGQVERNIKKLQKLDEQSPEFVRLSEETKECRELADKSAHLAAPFLHPKLNAMTVSDEDGGPLKIEIVKFGDVKAAE